MCQRVHLNQIKIKIKSPVARSWADWGPVGPGGPASLLIYYTHITQYNEKQTKQTNTSTIMTQKGVTILQIVMCPLPTSWHSFEPIKLHPRLGPWHPSLGQGSMWGVNAHERDHNPASCVTRTSFFMLVVIIFNGRSLSSSTQKALLNGNLKFSFI